MSAPTRRNDQRAGSKRKADRVDDRLSEQEKTFEAMYRTHYYEVLRYVRRRAPEDVARDVAADTFLVAWQRLDVIPEEPIPWLIGVARKTLANQRRSARRRVSLQTRLEMERQPLASAPEERPEETPLLIAFRRLPEKDQEVLSLIAWEALDRGQAAAVLGCSRVALRIRLHRARSRLLSELQRLDGSSIRRDRNAAVLPR